MKNYLIRAIDKNKSVRIFIADTTEIVREIRRVHQSSATGSAALGRLATISLIMGVTTKNDNEKLTIRFDGGGVGGKLIAVSNTKGEVKVTATNPEADAPSKYPGKLDVSAFVGKDGNLAVIRDYGLKEPYTGLSNIVTGEIAEDIANYYFYSEQTPSIVSLGVLVDTDLSIRAAGGIFVQVLPGIKDEELTILEKIASNLDPVSKMIDNGLTPEEILEKYFSEIKPEIIEKQKLTYKCDCSRERIEKGLISIGKKDLQHLLDEDGQAEVICDFCKTKYVFDRENLENLIKESK
ncbi:Hsp33 family molecular chaperone HslO [Helcococcus ovis]|uniref:Hsp33 family molecular chaperone HslO n=1 Tax=Helcococcus ovis TaxID=72026 RepID=UPI0038BCEF2C